MSTTKTIQLDLKIQIASDLHLEFYGDQPVPDDIVVPSAPVLGLLGDIGLAGHDNFRTFLLRQAARFEHVILLAGNHEYYNNRSGQAAMTVEEQQTWLKNVCRERPNLHFLERKGLEINGVVVLGTTLWSHIPQDVQAKAQSQMNDYHLSFISHNKKMRVKDTEHEFQRNVQWLEEQIDQAQTANKPVVVLTHHTPSLQGTSHPQYDGSDLSSCFSSDLTYLLERPNVKAWACGHTHYNFDFQVGGTRLVSNQRGYPGGAGELTDYDKEGVIIRVCPTS